MVGLAIINGHKAVVKVLLEKGSELESRDKLWSDALSGSMPW